MPGCMDDLYLKIADPEPLTVGEQAVEIAAVGFQIGGVEDGPKIRCTSLMFSPIPILAPALAFT